MFLIRMKIVLEHRVGSLKEASAAIQDRVNLHISECAIGGFHHAIWYSIAEPPASRIGRHFADWLGRGDEAADQTELLQAITDLAFRMSVESELIRLDLLRSSYEKHRATTEPKSGFLRRRNVEKAITLYDYILERLAPTADEEALRTRRQEISHDLQARYAEHIDQYLSENSDPGLKRFLASRRVGLLAEQFPDVVQCGWLSRMAWYAMFGRNSREPLEFTLDRRFGLRCNNQTWLQRTTDRDIEVGLALGAFHQRDKYLRLEVLPEQDERALYEISADYVAQASRASRVPESGCQGLLKDVLEVMQSQDVDAVQHFTMSTEQSSSHERGQLRFTAVVPPAFDSLRFRALFDDGPCKERIREVKSTPLTAWRLFVSHRAECPYKELLPTVCKAASRLGYTPVVVDAVNESVTIAVIDRIGASHAFIQLLYLHPAEIDDAKQLLKWVDAEYASART